MSSIECPPCPSRKRQMIVNILISTLISTIFSLIISIGVFSVVVDPMQKVGIFMLFYLMFFIVSLFASYKLSGTPIRGRRRQPIITG